MLGEEYMATTNKTPGSRRVTPSKTLPTEVRTPRSKREPKFGGNVPRVTVHTVHRVLTAELKCNHVLVDCRYPYEFEGGHILGARNYPPSDRSRLMDWLFSTENGQARNGPLILIMHCEFSQCRAPTLASDIIRYHSQLGLSTGLEVYVMKGGFCEFYRHYPQWCDPVGYVPMYVSPFPPSNPPRQHEPSTSSSAGHHFDIEMFIERDSTSCKKLPRRRRRQPLSLSSRGGSPRLSAAFSPMDYSPISAFADLSKAFSDDYYGGDDSTNSGGRGFDDGSPDPPPRQRRRSHSPKISF
jgi:hypothetical protein